jgi:hypothetical protein
VATSPALRTYDTEKLQALGNIYYEIEQFYYCIVLRTSLPPSALQAIKNAYLESMLVHVQVLKDFFERSIRKFNPKTQQEHDDVLSSDFGFPAAPVGLPEEIQTRINKELVHLSYSRSKRVTIEEKNWNFAPLLPLVIRSIEFIESRSQEELHRVDEYRAQNGVKPLASSWTNLRERLVALRLTLQSSFRAATTSSSL